MKTFKDEYGQNNTVIYENKSFEVGVDKLNLTIDDLDPNTVYHFKVKAVTVANTDLPAARAKARTHMRGTFTLPLTILKIIFLAEGPHFNHWM